MSRGLLHPEYLITDIMPLDAITSAFELVDQEEPETIKVVLEI
jgi:threonine dehydrogenase-like Zn-dependent dehydrogenase